jgi:hypothetical protein
MDPEFSAGKISYCQGCPESKAPLPGRIGVTHSAGLRGQLERILPGSDIDAQVLCLTISELPQSKEELQELVREFLRLGEAPEDA